MKRALSLIFLLLPEIAIFVFIAVCTAMVAKKGGPYIYLTAMSMIFVTDVRMASHL